MTFLIYSEDKDLAYQLLGGARKISDRHGMEVVSITIEDDTQQQFEYGADKVVKLIGMDFNPNQMKEAIISAVKRVDPSVLLIGATKRGKELAPRVASHINAGYMNECSNLELNDDNMIIVDRLTYGGSIISRQTCTSKPTVITVSQGVFEKTKPSKRSGEVIETDVKPVEYGVHIVEQRKKPKSSVDLENAQIIVSAGRGFKSKDDLKILEKLADTLGAQIGCTRPISADLGWMDQWVGISGKKVKPNLYIACGVSGTIQHAAGIRDSKIIVSINNDENAGIHRLSDYSIVGDIYEVVPALTKALKEAKQR
jgi:electron transfer flavoprotein alpha subunit